MGSGCRGFRFSQNELSCFDENVLRNIGFPNRIALKLTHKWRARRYEGVYHHETIPYVSVCYETIPYVSVCYETIPGVSVYDVEYNKPRHLHDLANS